MIWKFESWGQVKSNITVGSDGQIYFGDYPMAPSTTKEGYPTRGHLYSVDKLDGSLNWKFQTNDYISSSPSIGYDERIYFT